MRERLIEMMKYLASKICNFLPAVYDFILSWLEWQDAKFWAKYYHPGWVQIATKAKTKRTRQIYREKIIKAYRGM